MSNRSTRWQVIILDQYGERVRVPPVYLEDGKEVQAYCTEARHLDRGVQIWITPPLGGKPYTWD